MNGTELIGKISEKVREAGEIMLHAERGENYVDTKEGHANFVTVYDKMIQEKLKKDLLTILPEAVFVGEEEDVHAQIEKGLSFIVDPIDGTTNFIRDLHESAISVALLKDGAQWIGVCYNPYSGEMYTAEKGKGAYLNGKAIRVSSRELKDSIVLFGTAPYYPEYTKETFEMAAGYVRDGLDVRRIGSAVLDLCMVAAGKAEIFFEMRLSPWDYAAASLIVQEAGGTATQMNGEPLTMDRPCSVYAKGRGII